MTVIEHKIAQADLLILLSYLETVGFGYLPQERIENLKSYLTTFMKSKDMHEQIFLEPGEGHPFGPIFLSNRGTKRLIIKRLEMIER